MENPAAAANERARRCFADRPVARASGRTSSFSPKALHAHLRKGVGLRDVREHEIGVLPAVHLGLFMRSRRRAPGDGSIFSALFLGSPMKLMRAGLAIRYVDGADQRMLCTLAEEGLVHMSSHSSRIVRLQRLSFVPQPPKPLVSDMATCAAVSTPPFARQMHGGLRNYEASLLSVHSLAMLVRPSH